jgi:hypothetical protein
MHAGVFLVSGAVFVLLGFALVGGPMIVTDWSRKRREQVTARQIALTEALDGRLGAIVAPVVKKPLWGPWEIQIAVPFLRSAAVARILTVVGEVFSDFEGNGSSSYRVVLSAKQDPLRETREPRARGSAKRWARKHAAA